MKIPGQFGSSKPPARKAEPGTLDCTAFEQWLAESAEDRLSDAILEQMRAHAAGCAGCQEKLAQARRGREWLQVLKQEALEPPAGMVAKILAQTSLAGAPGTAEIPAGVEPMSSARPSGEWQPESQAEYVLPGFGGEAAGVMLGVTDRNLPKTKASRSGRSVPAWQRNTVVVLRRTLVDPRLAMVAAMAFFSITLTLNLVGVRLTNLHPADLAPSNMRRAASRQYAEVNARMARYYENLRIVYEVEARVQQLRRAAQTNPAPRQEARPRKRSSNSSGDIGAGEARRSREGLITKHSDGAPVPDPTPVRTGPRMDAALHLPGKIQGSAFDSPAAHSGQPFVARPITKLFETARPFCMVWFSRRFFSAPERGFA